MKYREVVSRVLVDRLAGDSRALIMGAGVADPKGIFGTTLEARDRFPGRVIETPLSENMLTGACVGLALEGWKPIFVHARADFSVLSWEHIINTGAKLPFLHPDLDFNVTVRALVGRGWGQGPLHSQAFHHLLSHVPGVQVFYPVCPESLVGIYEQAFLHQGVSVVFEPRRLYELETCGVPRWRDDAVAEIITFGDCVLEAAAAARELRYQGVSVNVFPSQHIDNQSWPTKLPVVYVDTAPRPQEKGWVTPPLTPAPMAAHLEREWYPTKEDIMEMVMGLLGRPYVMGDLVVAEMPLKGPF